MDLKFRKTLVEICKDIGTDDMEKLKFLLKDVTGSAKLEAANFAIELFSALENKRHVSMRDGHYLAECFFLIGRRDLVRSLNLEPNMIENEIEDEPKVLPYRILLYRLSEDITEKEFLSLKFYSGQSLGLTRRQLEKVANIFDLFVVLEKATHITPVRIGELREMVESLTDRGDLLDLIDEYQEKYPTTTDGGDSIPQNGRNSGTQPFESSPSIQDANTLMNSQPQNPTSNVKQRDPDTKVYDMTGFPRGYCIIINNSKFVGNVFHKPRTGSDVDAQNLQKTFARLGFDVRVYENLTEADMNYLMNSLSQFDHSKFNALIVCLLSHGDEQCVYGVDEKKIPIRELTSNFRSSKCPTLAGKPKLFFIQACQGHKTHKGYNPDIQHDGPIEGAQGHSDDLSTDVITVPSYTNTKVIPDESDFLIGFATVFGYLSYRHRLKGSFYIQKLTENLDKNADKYDLLKILTDVNWDVSNENIPGDENVQVRKQVPMPQYTLLKTLYFNPDNLPQRRTMHQPSDAP